jgi:hypothetical protein
MNSLDFGAMHIRTALILVAFSIVLALAIFFGFIHAHYWVAAIPPSTLGLARATTGWSVMRPTTLITGSKKTCSPKEAVAQKGRMNDAVTLDSAKFLRSLAADDESGRPGMNFFFFDTETTGLPNRSQNVPYNDPTQPHITQLGGILQVGNHDAMIFDTLVKPDNWRVAAVRQRHRGSGHRTHRYHGRDVRSSQGIADPGRDEPVRLCLRQRGLHRLPQQERSTNSWSCFEYARICPGGSSVQCVHGADRRSARCSP